MKTTKQTTLLLVGALLVGIAVGLWLSGADQVDQIAAGHHPLTRVGELRRVANVVAHERPDAVRLRPLHRLPPTRGRGQARHLGGADPTGRRVLGQPLAGEAHLLAAHQHDHADGDNEHRHVDGDVDDEEVGEEGGAVPERVQHDRGDQPDEERAEGPERTAALRRHADRVPDARGEQHVREGRQDAAHEEDQGDVGVFAVVPRHLEAEVLDVLGEREARSDHGRVDDAVQAYEASAKADPHSIETQLELGQGYVVTQQYTQAVTAFNAVLDGNPDEAKAYAGLGEAYFHQGQQQEAKQSFDQAIRRYLLSGRRDLAKEVKTKVDALLPADAKAKK